MFKSYSENEFTNFEIYTWINLKYLPLKNFLKEQVPRSPKYSVLECVADNQGHFRKLVSSRILKKVDRKIRISSFLSHHQDVSKSKAA